MGTPSTGHAFLVYVDKTATPKLLADYETADWQLIGGQKGLDFSSTLGVADVTSKDSENNTESLPTNRDRELTIDNLWERDDDGLAVVEKAHDQRETRLFRVVGPDRVKIFAGIVTEYSLGAPEDDAATLSISIKPTGRVIPLPAII